MALHIIYPLHLCFVNTEFRKDESTPNNLKAGFKK